MPPIPWNCKGFPCFFGYWYSKGLSCFNGPITVDEPLSAVVNRDLEEYVQEVKKRNKVPDLAMLLIHIDQVFYDHGFGVRDLQTKEAIISKTLFVVGSSTKLSTALMIASQVVEGFFNCDTSVKQLSPTFSLSDPQIT